MSSHNHTRKSLRSLVTLLPNIIAQCLFPCTQTDGSSQGMPMEERSTHRQEESDELRGLCQAAIHKLPDDVLPDIFNFYLDNDNSAYEPRDSDEWHTLVHVCRRWRKVVFASPRRLNLALLCGQKSPVRMMLDIWPAFPMDIQSHWRGTWEVGLDNIVAALEHRDRVRSIITLNFPTSAGRRLAEVIQVPFPELTCLQLWWNAGVVHALPDSFLGGSAPRLRTFRLRGMRYRAAAVLNVLSSASDLVDLDLRNIAYSDSEYISTESIVSCLSSLNRLETFHLGIRLRQLRQYRPRPQTRVVLPALSYLSFDGENEYSEDLAARIDTPRLSRLSLSFFPDIIFDIPQMKQLIGRAKGLQPFKVAKVVFGRWSIQLELDQPHGSTWRIGCMVGIDLQVSSMASVCSQLSPFFSLIERLDLVSIYSHIDPQRENATEPTGTQFLELFQPFPAVQSLYVSERLVPLVIPALRERIGERSTEVLPNLRDLFLGGYVKSGSVQDAIQSLLAAQRSSSQPIAFHHWGMGSVNV